MHPYVFQSESFAIGSYGVLLALAFIAGRSLFLYNLRSVLAREINSEALIVAWLIFGFIGAKLAFFLNAGDIALLKDWRSLTFATGLSSHGAMLAVIVVTIVFSKIERTPLYSLLDAAAPAAALAYAVVRVGCFLAGDGCYGEASDLPWAMAFPNGLEKVEYTVHPSPLYEAFLSGLTCLYLCHIYKREHRPFQVFFALLLCLGAGRFFIEFMGTNPSELFFLSRPQIASLIMVVGALYFLMQMPLRLECARKT